MHFVLFPDSGSALRPEITLEVSPQTSPAGRLSLFQMFVSESERNTEISRLEQQLCLTVSVFDCLFCFYKVFLYLVVFSVFVA